MATRDVTRRTGGRNPAYTGRVLRDKAVKEYATSELRKLAHMFLTEERNLTISECDEGYDPVPFPDNDCKYRGYCGKNKKKLQGYVHSLGYVVFADTEAGIYLEVLRLFVERGIIFPTIP